MLPSQKIQKTSRYAAIETLVRLQRTRYPVKPLFDSVADECRLLGAERGLAMNLVYGVLRRRQYLDLLLGDLCRIPVSRLDPFVYQALSTGLYQLFLLDRIPESAAVNETVNALKAAGLKKHLQGFVNGVLRTGIRQRSRLLQPDTVPPSGRPVLNHPDWLTSRWQDRFGREEMERICRVNNLEPSLTLRVNSARIDRDRFAALLRERGINVRPGRYAPDSLVLADYQGAVAALPGYDEGLFQVQDEAAQLAVLLLGPFTEPALYLDGCAGLGGKTGHIMQLMASGSRLVAVEPEPQRQRLLQENIVRLFPERQLTFSRTDLQEYRRTSRLQFDRVLIDAPCSGTGVIGRHPDIRWNRQPDDLPGYQLAQLELLAHAAELVAPEGVLVYATCSLEIEENQQVIEQFLADRREFVRLDCRRYLPDAAAVFVEDGYFSPHPGDAIDGFFAARLERRG